MEGTNGDDAGQMQYAVTAIGSLSTPALMSVTKKLFLIRRDEVLTRFTCSGTRHMKKDTYASLPRLIDCHSNVRNLDVPGAEYLNEPRNCRGDYKNF